MNLLLVPKCPLRSKAVPHLLAYVPAHFWWNVVGNHA
jgi:hypothetical protein